MKILFKREKVVTITPLVFMVDVILILTGKVTYNALKSIRTTKLNNLQADIDNLRDKISNYYSTYGKIPADTSIEYTNISKIDSIGATDTGPFYVIDLAAMENVSLNYGKDYEEIRKGIKQSQEEINKLTDLYIINSASHNIFYVEGIRIGSKIYHTDYTKEGADKVAVEMHVPEKTLAGDITKDDYGKTITGYKCTNGGAVDKWQIFYADGNNVYIIASDYIPYEYMPSGTLGHKANQGIHPGAGYFTDVLPDYAGSESITDTSIKNLNNSFYSQNLKSTNNNMKSVAYMLDTKAWEDFAGEDAEYAIGGPTIELYFNSYNKKYGTNYVSKANSTGYLIGSSTASATSLNLSKTDDKLFVEPDINKAKAMWIASPSSSGANNLIAVNNSGTVGTNAYNNNDCGFRPIVCLKSETEFLKNGNDSFSIAE